MIEFLFFQSMLLGLYYRWRSEHNGNVIVLSTWKIVGCISLLVIYFFSKLLFVKVAYLAPFQIINQIILWALLYMLFGMFMYTETYLRKIESTFLWKCISFISERTLEIYLVQYILIDKCRFGKFPINWFILTFMILISAFILRWVSQQIIKIIKL